MVALAVEQCLHGARPRCIVAPVDVPYRAKWCPKLAVEMVPVVMPGMTLVPVNPPVHID